MAVITKGATGLVLTTAANWVGGLAPGAADVARWASTSSSGNHTGSLTLQGVQIDGAAGTTVVGYTSGTLTLTQTDAIVFGTSNNASFEVFSSGVIALGSGNRNFKIAGAAGSRNQVLVFQTNGSLTGSGTLTIIDAAAGTLPRRQVAFGAAHTGFTGTVVFDGNVELLAWNTNQTCLTAANITVNGDLCALRASATGTTLGASGRTLTINNDVILGLEPWTIASNVVLAGTGTRTLTVNGNTTMTGTVTGTAGISPAMASASLALQFTGVTSALTGPCVVSGGRFLISQELTANRYAPSSLVVNAGASFEYNRAQQDFNFPVAPTGEGVVGITGSLSGVGCTFTAGTLSGFNGSVLAFTGATTSLNNLVKIVIHELPGNGLIWRASATTGGTSCAALATYGGASNLSDDAPLVIDSAINQDLSILTAGTYSLIVPSSSGTFSCSGTVTRTNSAATSSARMSLTLGGTNTGNNTLSGDISEVGTNSAILGLTKVDAGRWVLSGANSSHTGIHTVSAGTLSAQSAKALGSATSAGGVTISGTGVLELAGGITLNKSATAFTIHQTSPITSVGDNTVQTAGITLGGTTTFEVTTGNRLAIANSGAITDGASTFGVTKTGDGELALAAFANTYDGAVTVTAGTLAIGSVGALGTGVATVQLTGNLKYTGATATLSRATQLNGSAPSFEASGSGALTVSTLSSSTSAKTLTLKGSNTGANTITSTLADNTGALSLAKEDAGKWVVTTRTYSGTTAVNAGTLRCEASNSATTTGAVTIGASGTVELVTNTLASSGAGNGEVLGTGNVTCNGGIIKTRGGTTQKGQVRYGGNLTFGAGSSLYIGAAA